MYFWSGVFEDSVSDTMIAKSLYHKWLLNFAIFSLPFVIWFSYSINVWNHINWFLMVNLTYT